MWRHNSRSAAVAAPLRGLSRAIAAHVVGQVYPGERGLTVECWRVSAGLNARNLVGWQRMRTLMASPNLEYKAHDSADSSRVNDLFLPHQPQQTPPALQFLIPVQNQLEGVKSALTSYVGCPTSRWWLKPNLVLREFGARSAAFRLSKLRLSLPSCTFTAGSEASTALWQDSVA